MLRRLIGLATMSLVLTGLVTVTGTSPATAGVTILPVPTSAAGLGRIVTAPDGSMWFTETADAVNKIGRVTPQGAITEITLPALGGGSDYAQVKDLDVGPDGTLWVVYDSGEEAVHLDAAGSVIGSPVSLGSYPYGEAVRVAPDGTPWVTMSYDDDGLARIVNGQTVWYDNAPPCDGALGRAKDGSMWCQQFDKVIHSNADASGGTTYPLPADVSYPYHLAPGPVGSIWLARRFEGTIYTPADDGNIGFLDQSTGQFTKFDTGSRTAPGDLLEGPDHDMWFVNGGAAPAIGHISATGVGAIHTVGNYKPTSLTFAQDGAIWFTDAEDNVIGRVLPSDLQNTDIDPGDGSVFHQGPAPHVQVAALTGVGHVVRIKKGRIPLRLTCAKAAASCKGRLTISTTGRHPQPVVRPASYGVKAGGSHGFRLALTARGRHLVRAGHTTALTVRLYLPGKHKAAVVKQIRVRRP